MPIDVSACASAEEQLSALAPVFHYFGMTPAAQEGTRFLPFIEPSRTFAAWENGATVAGCASFPFEMTVPGGSVRCSGLSVVGVMPTHRRRGVLRSMMRAQLDDTHRRGEPIAALWASEDGIYGQFGYGIASFSGDIEVPKSMTAFVQPFEPRGEFRILNEAEALGPLSQAYERIRLGQPGMIRRSDEWWQKRRLETALHACLGHAAPGDAVIRGAGEPIPWVDSGGVLLGGACPLVVRARYHSLGKPFEVPRAVAPVGAAILVGLLGERGGDGEVRALKDHLAQTRRNLGAPLDDAVVLCGLLIVTT